MPTSICQPTTWLNPNCWYKFTQWMTNSPDPDHWDSEEATYWSGSTLFVKAGCIQFSRTRVKSVEIMVIIGVERSEEYGQRHVIRGIWSEAYDQRHMVRRHMIRGIWSETYDQRRMVRGIWSEAYGQKAYGQKAYDQRHMVRGIWSEA